MLIFIYFNVQHTHTHLERSTGADVSCGYKSRSYKRTSSMLFLAAFVFVAFVTNVVRKPAAKRTRRPPPRCRRRSDAIASCNFGYQRHYLNAGSTAGIKLQHIFPPSSYLFSVTLCSAGSFIWIYTFYMYLSLSALQSVII